MPVLINPRWEAYSQSRAVGHSQAESARRAGYVDTYALKQSVKLERKAAIRVRLAELRERADEATRPGTLAYVNWTFHEIVQKAMTDGEGRDLSTACRAVEALAKVNGLIVSESRTTSESVQWDKLSPEQLQVVLAKRMQTLTADERKLLATADPSIVEVLPASG